MYEFTHVSSAGKLSQMVFNKPSGFDIAQPGDHYKKFPASPEIKTASSVISYNSLKVVIKYMCCGAQRETAVPQERTIQSFYKDQ